MYSKKLFFVNLILLISTVVYCGKKISPVDNLPLNEYPLEVKRTFVSSCVGGGGLKDRCECLLDKLQRKFTINEFLEMDKEIAKTKTMPIVYSSFLSSIVPYCQ